MNKQIETIHKACIAANPGKSWEEFVYMPNENKPDAVNVPVRLADVLLAIEEKLSSGSDVVGRKFLNDMRLVYETLLLPNSASAWDLHKDCLEDQSENTVEFLASLLGHEKRVL